MTTQDGGRTELGLVWAQARNGVIGNDGALPWHIPDDMAHFRRLTTGAPVIMGRATWESLPPRFRPLPGRRNVVLSRTRAFTAPGARVVSSLDDAFEAARPGASVAWVIGGAQVYASAMPRADVLVVTHVELDAEGDALAPEIGAEWLEVAVHGEGASESRVDPSTGIGYRIVTYRRATRPVSPGAAPRRS